MGVYHSTFVSSHLFWPETESHRLPPSDELQKQKSLKKFMSERIQSTNVLKRLELHTKVFGAEEQKKIVECVYNLQHMDHKGQLREHVFKTQEMLYALCLTVKIHLQPTGRFVGGCV